MIIPDKYLGWKKKDKNFMIQSKKTVDLISSKK